MQAWSCGGSPEGSDSALQGRTDPIFDRLAERQHALQWHSVCVAQPPEDAVVLASSPVCRVQAMRVGPCAWSMQYHVEVEDDTVRNWGDIDAYRRALESTLGPGSIDALAADADRHMEGFVSDAQQLYRNFMAAAQP